MGRRQNYDDDNNYDNEDGNDDDNNKYTDMTVIIRNFTFYVVYHSEGILEVTLDCFKVMKIMKT